MLALSPLGSLENDADVVVVDGKLLLEDPNMDIIHEFYDGNYDFLDSIDFDNIFNGDVLPDLEMVDHPTDILVPELYASGEENNKNNHSSAESNDDDGGDGNSGRISASDSSSGSGSKDGGTAARKKVDKRRKSSFKNNRSKNSSHQEGKRKVKVDWTPELHKRFVEAVEKLGVDKAVPSRILEVMETCSLTRHNIASHLQKYRSHQKHLLVREAEAASWNQRRRMYAAPHLGSMRDAAALAPWVAAPAMGFPSVSPPQHHYRPLHVWGHPTMNRPVIQPWPNPNHVPHPPPLPMAWAATTLQPPPLSPSYWAHPQHHLATVAPTLPARFFAQPAGESTTGFVPPPVPGVAPPTMFEADHRTDAAPLPPEFHPSKETIDAAIEEVLSNRTLPLPLGLKPPSMDGVIGELQRQGLTKIPQSSSSSSLVADNHQSLASTTIA